MPQRNAQIPPAISELTPAAQAYLRNIRSRWKIKFYLINNLPSALWWGIRLKYADPDRAEATLPYSWRTKNPFRSIYFAAQAGAGEFSTGVLANLARQGKGNISMLVLEQRAEFLKKASSLTTFACEQGREAQEAVRRAILTNEPQALTMLSTGRNADGEVVSRIYITWTFKAKT